MSKIDTIENISNTLAASSIMVVPKRCVYIRNWHSKCKACLNACQHEAIKRSLGRLSIDFEACTNCGACVCACPTSTMLTTAPAVGEIVKRARRSAELNAGNAAFICERQALEFGVDSERVVVLPCLDYLNEYMIAGMFALDFKRVVLFTCGCEGCEIDCAEPYFEEMIRSAEYLFELWKIRGEFRTLSEVPPTLLLDKQRSKNVVVQSDRREAFKQTGASALEYAFQSVGSVIGNITGNPVVKSNEDKQIVMRLEERYDPATYTSVRLLRMLDHIGTHPNGATVESRFWASVDIDPNACKHCGGCARMCPTEALVYSTDENEHVTMTFAPALCINCGLCRDACLSHSMLYTNKVPASELVFGYVKTLFEDEEIAKHKVGL